MQFLSTFLLFLASASATPLAFRSFNNLEDTHPIEVGLSRRQTNNCIGGTTLPIGYGRLAIPDTVAAFSTNTAFSAIASAAAAPPGYNIAWMNGNASNQADGYMGYIAIASYNTTRCAEHCAKTSGCNSFNICAYLLLHFSHYTPLLTTQPTDLERNPSIDPTTGMNCSDPPSTTTIKCAIWSTPLDPTSATNTGQWRANFQVVIAASNAYSLLPIVGGTGFTTPIALPDAAIISPMDCNGQNSYMGYVTVGEANATFDTTLCLAACEAANVYALAHPPTSGAPQLCRFWNTYLLMRNGTSTGQTCAMYSQSWNASYATNFGQYRGFEKYTISQSYMSSNETDGGICVPGATTNTTLAVPRLMKRDGTKRSVRGR